MINPKKGGFYEFGKAYLCLQALTALMSRMGELYLIKSISLLLESIDLIGGIFIVDQILQRKMIIGYVFQIIMMYGFLDLVVLSQVSRKL